MFALAMLQNVWRPVLIGRVADQAGESTLATVLSVESQAKSLGVALFAPLIVFGIDATPQRYQFLSLGICGAVVAGLGLTLACSLQKAWKPATELSGSGGMRTRK